MDFKDHGESDAEGPVVLMSCDPQVQHPVVPELWKRGGGGGVAHTEAENFLGYLVP